jgi:hypothetical protein
MINLEALANQLLSCAYGVVSIGQFDGWFEEASWNVHQSGNGPLIDAIFEIEGILSDSNSQNMDEASTRKAFLELASSIRPLEQGATELVLSKPIQNSFEFGPTGKQQWRRVASGFSRPLRFPEAA